MRLPLPALACLAFACAPAQPKHPGVSHVVPTDARHTATCSDACGNEVNPPTGGPHCASTAPCREYDTPQPRCEWIHNLEHGHAVLAYNCPQGCPDEVEALRAIRAERGPSRILLTPDPLLPHRVAAIVWAWSYSGDHVDADAIAEVLSHQDEEAPEPGLGCAP